MSEATEAAERLINQITRADEGTLSRGVPLSTRDVWTVLSAFHALRIENAGLEAAYAEALEDLRNQA